MNIFNISWLDDCPRCNCGTVLVETNSDDEELLYEEDHFTCASCNAKGTVNINDNIAYAVWDYELGYNVLSLFDGISAGRIALDRAHILVNNYYASEVDKHAIKVTQANWPDTTQLGDVTQWRNWDIDWANIDLLIGGSPCQGFSFAGKQLAFDDPRSVLFFEYVNILNHIKSVNPRVKFMLENVRMKKEFTDVIDRYLGVDYITINSRLVSAQNRVRLYWTNIERVTQPTDKDIKLADILEDAFDEKYLHTPKGIAYMDRTVKGGRSHWDFGHHSDSSEDKSACLTANIHKGVPYNVLVTSSTEGDRVVRKFTPIECERLQTIPPGYTSCVSDTQRYRSLGNGWTVDVIAHIFRNLD